MNSNTRDSHSPLAGTTFGNEPGTLRTPGQCPCGHPRHEQGPCEFFTAPETDFPGSIRRCGCSDLTRHRDVVDAAPAPLTVQRVSPTGAVMTDGRPDGDTTSGRVWACFCGASVPSWDLQDHLIGHSG